MLLYGTGILYKYIKKQTFQIKKIPSFASITLNVNKNILLFEKNKIKNCQRTLIKIKIYNFFEKLNKKFLIFLIQTLNNNTKLNAITLNSPILKKINIKKISNFITMKKNIDNINYNNEKKYPKTCIATAIKYSLLQTKKNFTNLKTVLVGKTPAVGQQLLKELVNFNLNIMFCDLNYKKLKEEIKTADLVILATGIPSINIKILKKKIFILDVGVTTISKKITGDLIIKKNNKSTNYYTPVPGGIGPLTMLAMLKNIKKTFFLNNNDKYIKYS